MLFVKLQIQIISKLRAHVEDPLPIVHQLNPDPTKPTLLVLYQHIQRLSKPINRIKGAVDHVALGGVHVVEDGQLLACDGVGAKEHGILYLSIHVEKQRLELQCRVGLHHDTVCIHALNGVCILRVFDDVPGLNRLLLNK